MTHAMTPYRLQLVERLVPVFAEHGWEGATMSRIAGALGLGKATLYHHFPDGKQSIAEAVLEFTCGELERVAFRHLDDPGARGPRLERTLRGLETYFGDGTGNCTLAVFAIVGSEGEIGPTVARRFDDWITRTARVLDGSSAPDKRAQRRARDGFVRIWGGWVMSRVLRDPAPFRKALKAVRKDFCG